MSQVGCTLRVVPVDYAGQSVAFCMLSWQFVWLWRLLWAAKVAGEALQGMLAAVEAARVCSFMCCCLRASVVCGRLLL